MCYHFVLNFAHYGRTDALDVCGKGRIWYKTIDKCLWSTYDFKIYMISFVKLFLPLLVMTFLVYIKINMFIFFYIIPVYSCWYFVYAVCYVCAEVPESWQSFSVKHMACQVFSVCCWKQWIYFFMPYTLIFRHPCIVTNGAC